MESKGESGFSWKDLLSSDADQAARAAVALLESAEPSKTMAAKDAGTALENSVEAGNRTAASVLLLGYTQSGDLVLQHLLREHSQEPVKLKPWSRPVPLEVAALTALSRRGGGDARSKLLHAIAGYDNPVRVFLLDILPYLDAPEVWHAVSGYLEDTTEIPEGVPSGAIRRRVCDHAVDAFVSLFHLPVTFSPNPGGRYQVDEIAETQRLFQDKVPM